MQLGKKIKTARRNSNLTLRELSEKLGVAYSTCARYESDDIKPSFELLVKIAKVCGITVNWFASDEGMVDNSPDAIIRESSPIYSTNSDDFYYLPLYNVYASAGHGAFNDDHPDKKFLAMRKEFIQSDLHASPSDLFFIFAQGDSMTPFIQNSDVLLCDKSKTKIQGDGIYVVRIADSLVIKAVQLLPDSKLNLTSFNQLYPPIRVDLEKETNIAIVAKVLWFCRKVS